MLGLQQELGAVGEDQHNQDLEAVVEAVATLATLVVPAVRGGGRHRRSSKSKYIQLRHGHARRNSSHYRWFSWGADHNLLESAVAVRPAGSGRTVLGFPV